MSDREGHIGSGSTDDDLSLPKATVAKMISGEWQQSQVRCRDAVFKHLPLCATELLPNEVTCAKETRDLVIECCVGEHTL